jgi:putative nucleotidyltransferase with HDIG domain
MDMHSFANQSQVLDLLVDLGQALYSTLELDQLLSSICDFLQAKAGAADSAIWLLQHNCVELECCYASSAAAATIGRAVRGERFLAAYQSVPTNVIRIDDSRQAPDWLQPLGPTPDGRPSRLLGAFLIARNELLGLICLANPLEAPPFSESEAQLINALIDHVAVSIRTAQLYAQERQNEERQQLLEQISRYLQQTLDLEVLIPRIFSEVNKAIDAEAQSIWLVDAQAHNIVCRFATGPGTDLIKQVTVPIGKGIVGSCVEKQESFIIADAQKDIRFFRGADAKTGLITHSIMSVPMVREGKSIGAIQAINKKNGALFNYADLDLFRSIADSAALAIENARLYADLDISYNNTLDALTAALDLRDRETEGHSRRVVEYTAQLATAMGLSRQQVAVFRRGALIHDIGKIGVPDAVLLKPGPLDADERAIIEKHPQAGYEMLMGIPYLQEEIKIVLAHQEKWDGSGYPFGLKGEAIPLGARLFSIADTFDALLSDRPYRKGRSYLVARDIIAAEAGRQFDPQAVTAFLSVSPEVWDRIRVEVMAHMAQRRQLHAESVRGALTGGLTPITPFPAPAGG